MFCFAKRMFWIANRFADDIECFHHSYPFQLLNGSVIYANIVRRVPCTTNPKYLTRDRHDCSKNFTQSKTTPTAIPSCFSSKSFSAPIFHTPAALLRTQFSKSRPTPGLHAYSIER